MSRSTVNLDSGSIPSVVVINQSNIPPTNQSTSHSRSQSRHSSGNTSSNSSTNQSTSHSRSASASHSRSDSGLFDDDFQSLLTPINQRLQLANACLLVLTRILQQLKEYSDQQEHAKNFNKAITPTTKQTTKHNQDHLLSSLDEAQHDAQVTIDELTELVKPLNDYVIDPNWTKTKAKRIRETRNRCIDQTKDVEIRFNQINNMAEKYQSLPRSNSYTCKQVTSQSTNQPKNPSPHPSPQRTHEKHSPHASPLQNKQVKQASPQRTTKSHHHQQSHQPTNQSTNDLQYQQSSFMSREDVVLDPYMEQDAAERLSLIHSIERDVSLVHDMYNEIHSLVHHQGDAIDTIEDSITVSMNKTEDAEDQLLQLEASRRRKRRRMMCCVIWGSVVCLILLFVIYVMLRFPHA